MATTLTSKGQVTVPKKIRDYLGLHPGSAVDFSLGPNGEVIVRPAEDTAPTHRKDRFGKLRGTLNTGRTTDELMRLLRGYDADINDPGLK
ncbi:AbrB/MazE/SpoVT family DNA-binding domain-containing protein [Nitrosococcus wardiae]|uniref:AbrB/MazE/SpoVT family DNA-binding domain-containing protein n=1 Tax=Nitrosococcus wardiae TaxID=1814290 RepID=A0A4P7BTQ2_9GAMM|nr:AbrB/MazE/SpoVT family DNA-binding domain-containing protein [Nitrosococcus wardiae]QBQ53258.1 AbrB/MazE/SpoVT family DNA-binding domain-containing protein [Nitrosococcus wardiae]